MARQQQPAPIPPQTSGPISAVPCPHCGRPNDYRDIHKDGLLDTGAETYCDHCDGAATVTAVRNVTLVGLRRENKRVAAPQGAAPARTMSAAQAQRMLKGR